jgi:hypothetical protein
MPSTSRFPLSLRGGGSGPARRCRLDRLPAVRLRYAVRPVECGKHSKRPTQKSKITPRKIASDGQEAGYTTDTEHYVEMDEE